MDRIGLKVPASRTVRDLAEAEELADAIGFPLIIRPSFTLGGKGGRQAHDHRELRRAVTDGLDASPWAASSSKERRRLEGVRARGHARPRRQRRSSSAPSRT
jgi:carbamoylphosphate synthase large subunit